MNKLFNEMSAAERQKYLIDLTSYTDNILPTLERLGDSWDMAAVKNMLTGLELVSAFQFARDFYQQALAFQDYNRRVNRLRYYINKIQQKISEGKAIKGEAISHTAKSSTTQRKIGRPTVEERKNHIEDEKKRLVEERKTSLFPEAVPSNVVPLTWNGVVGNMDGVTVSQTMPHLDQIAWLLSKTLQEETRNIREMRAEAASNAERAKVLAEQGAQPDVVKPFATRAEEITTKVSDIYKRIDNEMAELYIRLKNDPHTVSRYEKTRPDATELKQMLKPFYTKVVAKDADFEQGVIDKISAEDPELAKKREAEKEKHNKVVAIIKYLTRKDKPSTFTRVNSMTARLKELGKLIGKEQAKPYYKLLEKTKTEAEAEQKDAVEKVSKAKSKKGGKS